MALTSRYHAGSVDLLVRYVLAELRKGVINSVTIDRNGERGGD